MFTFIIACFFFCILKKQTLCDHAEPWQLTFPDPATPAIEGIISLHNEIIFVLVVIGILVSLVLLRATLLFNSS